jgi:hypothetical protein
VCFPQQDEKFTGTCLRATAVALQNSPAAFFMHSTISKTALFFNQNLLPSHYTIEQRKSSILNQEFPILEFHLTLKYLYCIIYIKHLV